MTNIRCADEECNELNETDGIKSFTCKKCGIFNLVVDSDSRENAINVYDKDGKLLEA